MDPQIIKNIQDIININSGNQTRIVDVQKISGGINSKVYKLMCINNENFCLKLYPYMQLSRQKVETEFLKYAEATCETQVPKVIHSDSQAGWNLMTWLDGAKPEQIDSALIKNICNFMEKLNKDNKKLAAKKKQIGLAAESITSSVTLKDSIIKRITRIEKVKARNNRERQIKLWHQEKIQKSAEYALSIFEKKCEQEHWDDRLSNELVLSPSDVGLHNMLINGSKIYYFDFEYAGWDDLSKYAADWVLQPEQPLIDTYREVELITNMSNRDFASSSQWMSRYKDILPLIFIKWCYIMMRGYGQEDFSEVQLMKIKKYYEKFNYLVM